jgi:vitamin B12 transporter
LNSRGVAFALALVALAAAGAPAARAMVVTGVVVDHRGQPVEFANVRVVALQRGAVTSEAGRFSLELPDGPATLDVTQVGYERARIAVMVEGGLAPLRIVLAEEPVPVAEVTVAASSFGKTGKSEGAVVRRSDVLMTPGGAADIFQSLRALPGITAPAEGAALYVRGGAPDETIIRIDGAEIGHPYHYEGASGGLFSILDTYMLKSAFFSSGGFGSRYGGAMSGVLDIETQDPMNLRTFGVGANLTGYSVSGTWALVPNRLSLMGSVVQSFPELLFRLYGSVSEYTQAPASQNGVAKLQWRYSPTGRLSVFGIGSSEHLGVVANVLSVRDVYASNAKNGFGALHLQDALLGRAAIRANLTTQHYRSGWTYSEFGGRRTEHVAQGDVDVVWPLGKRHELTFGAIVRRRAHEDTGLAAADSTDLGAGAPTRPVAIADIAREPGVYAEDKLRLWGPLYATLGTRVDRDAAARAWNADPRAALAWRVDEHQTLRLATGRYHQLADPAKRDPLYGNPTLESPYADHVIAGYEWKSEFGNVRLEGYQKRYHRLPVVDPVTWYRAAGTGRARGVDVFVQGTYRSLNGWVSYGWLDSRRRQLDDPTEVPASGAVKHSLSVVGQYQIDSHWSTGLRWSWSSGRPYTPVVGAIADPVRGIWRPVYGAHGSALMPAYGRVDFRLLRLFSLPRMGGIRPSNVCVTYLEAMNVLGTPNILEYVYNADYSVRHANNSYFSRRLLVAGFTLSW